MIGRNYDNTGTLKVYLIETGEIVNRAKMKQKSTKLAELCRRRLEAFCRQPVSENDLIQRLSKLRKSSKKRSADEISPSDPPQLIDAPQPVETGGVDRGQQ